MSLSALCIRRPVATILLTLGLALAGIVCFGLLPVAPLPQVDFPTIAVQASLPGASPETMAATVATPLERALGRISGITEMTSSSSLGNTRIILQFDLNRDINGAARDVQAAINAARALLPSGLPSNPIYRKINPADAPVMILALTSATLNRGQMYDAASTILAQKLSQIDGIGQVVVGGSSLPAVRVELSPKALEHEGISLETVRTAIAAFNANRPKGILDNGQHQWLIQANDQSKKAADYMPLIVAWRNGAAVRLKDVAQVEDSVQDLHNDGLANGKPAVVVILYRQPGANIIDTVDRVKAELPGLKAAIPGAIHMSIALDRTPTIRASLADVERTLLISIALVVMVVFLFLRNARSTVIPSIAVSVSLIGTFAVMYLCSYSLDNLSLMALTVATGFVVDDAIVVLENVTRHLEAGEPPITAAIQGAREVTFTVISMSISLIAVFLPVLLMGGIIGRLFREFAVTLSVAILVSLVVSLTTTPMLCARVLRTATDPHQSLLHRLSEHFFNALLAGYARTLKVALRYRRLTLLSLAAVVGLNVYLYTVVPKGFFPQQDTGRVIGFIQADQSISFQAMRQKLADFVRIVKQDPAVDSVIGFTGGGQTNSGFMFMELKPYEERQANADAVIARLRKKLAREPGATLYLQASQDIRMGGRPANAQYQYTLQADDIDVLRAWMPKILHALTELPQLADVNSDQQDHGEQTSLVIDRDAAARLGVSPALIDATLNDAFGQRQVSTIYAPLNQYHVVMEVAPSFRESAGDLQSVWLIPASGKPVPLSAVTHMQQTNTPLSVNHQGQFVAGTISFNLPQGVSLSQATNAISYTLDRIGVPSSIHGSFQGTAKAFQASLDSQPWLILAALATVYIVLGMLYESYVHPLTILSTLPSAGVGAILALMLCHTEFSIMSLIGVLLLIGIVKKNAILMIDFAISAERERGLAPQEAIFDACLHRFRPIMMTTLAALLGALPLMLGSGEGSELRRPLGISIVGGLLVSQVLTLYTTPVVYFYLERFRRWSTRRRFAPGLLPGPKES